jgi:hypothetical protein
MSSSGSSSGSSGTGDPAAPSVAPAATASGAAPAATSGAAPAAATASGAAPTPASGAAPAAATASGAASGSATSGTAPPSAPAQIDVKVVKAPPNGPPTGPPSRSPTGPKKAITGKDSETNSTVSQATSKASGPGSDGGDSEPPKIDLDLGNEDDYLVLTPDELRTVSNDQPTLIFDKAIVFVQKPVPNVLHNRLRSLADPNVKWDPLNILAFSGHAIKKMLAEIHDGKNIDPKLTKLFFIRPLQVDIGGKSVLPAQNVFLCVFAQFVFLANVQKPGMIDIHRLNFEEQYNAVRSELKKKTTGKPAYFGHTRDEFDTPNAPAKFDIPEDASEENKKRIGLEQARRLESSTKRRWWLDISFLAFNSMTEPPTFSEFLQIFEMGSSYMLRYLQLEKSYFNTIHESIERAIEHLNDYRQTNLLHADTRELTEELDREIGRLRRSLGRKIPIKARLPDFDALVKKLQDNPQGSATPAETSEEDAGAGTDGDDSGTDDGSDHGSVSSASSGRSSTSTSSTKSTTSSASSVAEPVATARPLTPRVGGGAKQQDNSKEEAEEDDGDKDDKKEAGGTGDEKKDAEAKPQKTHKLSQQFLKRTPINSIKNVLLHSRKNKPKPANSTRKNSKEKVEDE